MTSGSPLSMFITLQTFYAGKKVILKAGMWAQMLANSFNSPLVFSVRIRLSNAALVNKLFISQ